MKKLSLLSRMFGRIVFGTAVLMTALPLVAADDVKTVPAKNQVSLDKSRLTPELVGLAKLVQSGVDGSVIAEYIASGAVHGNPTADELVYLHELELSSENMVALMRSEKKASLSRPESEQPKTFQAPRQETLENVQPPPLVQSAPTVSAPVAQQPAPGPTVVYTQPASSTVYVESSPVVTYLPSYPAISFGLDFGHFGFFHHGGHFGGHHSFGHDGGHHGGH